MLVLERQRASSDPALDSYFEQIGRTTLLTDDEEHDLALRVQQGDVEAREHMVKANLRLVVRMARRYLGKGLGLQDLIQEGNLGLVHAVERFDPEQGTRFCTYAKFWIQECIQKALEKMAGPMRLPGYANDLRIRWRHAEVELHEQLNRPPRDEEVARRLGLSRRQLGIVKKAQRIYSPNSRLDSEGDPTTAADTLKDIRHQSPSAGLTADDELRHVFRCLHQLNQREAMVVRMRFGLEGQEPMSLHGIGEKLGLTRERVRQIESEALAKLRRLVADSE